MNRPSVLVLSVCAALLASGALAIAAPPLRAGPASDPAAPAAATTAARPWSAAGGSVGIRWNRGLAHDLGLTIVPVLQADGRLPTDPQRFVLGDSRALQFQVDHGYVRAFRGGALQARGGYRLQLPGGAIDLTSFRLQPRATAQADGQHRMQLDLVGADGQAWLYIDRVMHEMQDGNATLAVRSSDVRISAALARRLGRPNVGGWTIAELDLRAPVMQQGSGAAPLPGAVRWPGTAAPDGGTYQVDLFMQDISMQYLRCSGCSGDAGTGRLAIAPSSTLRNNVNAGTAMATVPGDPLGTSKALWTAGVAWYSKFSGPNPPYGNDQHPYLIWNMYRENADGSLEQIGRSGVKHAYLTTNGGCLDSSDHDSHILGRGCDDTYSVSNNDDNRALGPRSEILPATGQWGRCGSIFDPGCTGAGNGGNSDPYYQRLVVNEAQLGTTANPGARFQFESWYVARGDIDIFNSMATVQSTPRWAGGVWNFPGSGYRLGAAIDNWVAPVPLPRALPLRPMQWSEALVADGAHAKVAVKVVRLPGGLWQYHYAVMNFDFAFAQTSGAEPNLRITAQQGFDGFSLATASAAGTQGRVFRDGDLVAANDWVATATGDAVAWKLGSDARATLGWGVLYGFSVTSNAAPRLGTATLSASNAAVPRSFAVRTIVPGAPPRPCSGRACE